MIDGAPLGNVKFEGGFHFPILDEVFDERGQGCSRVVLGFGLCPYFSCVCVVWWLIVSPFCIEIFHYCIGIEEIIWQSRGCIRWCCFCVCESMVFAGEKSTRERSAEKNYLCTSNCRRKWWDLYACIYISNNPW